MKSIELSGVCKRYNKTDRCFGKKDFFWALSDISFSVDKGEAVGMIGPNGAGKTTLMRLVSGISLPTKGAIDVTGKVVPLISIEGALQYILTGRENAFLLLAAFGVKKEVRKKIFEEISEFSGISGHMDIQISKLSSGMRSRLSFSIAAHVPSDILLIDEVLAVGDQQFQQKCTSKIEQFKKDGKTIVFISHDMESVKTICGKVIWLDRGSIVAEGPPGQIIQAYLSKYRTTDKTP